MRAVPIATLDHHGSSRVLESLNHSQGILRDVTTSLNNPRHHEEKDSNLKGGHWKPLARLRPSDTELTKAHSQRHAVMIVKGDKNPLLLGGYGTFGYCAMKSTSDLVSFDLPMRRWHGEIDPNGQIALDEGRNLTWHSEYWETAAGCSLWDAVLYARARKWELLLGSVCAFVFVFVAFSRETVCLCFQLVANSPTFRNI